MGYNIEISFNIIKQCSVIEIIENVKSFAKFLECEIFYHDYEMEFYTLNKRNHCIITVVFSQNSIINLIKFLKYIKKQPFLHIESIFNDKTNILIYTSKYYKTKMMNKISSSNLNILTNEENDIINIIKKK